MRQNVELLIENVRCFTNPAPVPLRKLTLLVGENSTGKSTFLALVRLAWDLSTWRVPFNFNEEPFMLGSFKEIASYQSERLRTEQFSVGYRIPIPRRMKERAAKAAESVEYKITFRDSSSYLPPSQWGMSAGKYSVLVTFGPNDKVAGCRFSLPSGDFEVPDYYIPSLPNASAGRPSFLLLPRFFLNGPPFLSPTRPKKEEIEILEGITVYSRMFGEERPYAFAPVRTKPKRTYDPISELPTPEGGHIPLVLARTFAENKSEWKKLKTALDEFGKASGLFENLEVRQLGDTEGDPFQIRIKFGKPAFNLMDVGYGVSQALPLVVDALRAEKGSTFLIQQPEVHLHPRAQAAFGSLLAGLAVHQDKTFVVETHSDHIVDRVRMDVRDKKSIKPEDVVILYFERKNGSTDVDIHPLFVDEEGNLLDAPDSYRQFFLQEERRFLGV